MYGFVQWKCLINFNYLEKSNFTILHFKQIKRQIVLLLQKYLTCEIIIFIILK